MNNQAENLLLEARGISKHYGGAVALDSVDFDLRSGEIHGLLGENGAGKSTLIKVLAGVVPRDTGEIRMGDQVFPHRFSGPEALAAGLAFVHQDLGLVETLSVAENVALATRFSKRRGLISFAATERRVAGLLDELAVAISPRALIGELDQDARVMVAIARAFALKARAIVLDEVSSSLPAPVVARLADALRASSASGVSYVYVTHRLEELSGLIDRVTVLRNGRKVASEVMARVEHQQLVTWILGESPTPSSSKKSAAASGLGGRGAARSQSPHGDRQDGDSSVARLSVRNLQGSAHVGPISFDARRGEIVGICGLVGSGTHELAEMLGGSRKPVSGEALLDGKPLALGDTYRLRAAGCTYVPGNRQREGAVMSMTVQENLYLSRHKGSSAGLVGTRREGRAAAALADRFVVRPKESLGWSLASLSGGNQQKVIMARALQSAPRLLVVDDPTAGVDIGSRAELHRILRSHAQSGAVVVLVSTDFEEVAAISDRAIALRAGTVVEEFAGQALTAGRLAQASYGIQADQLEGADL